MTPFDREDIQTLAWTLDEVLDYICSVAQKIKLYKPRNIMKEFFELADIIHDCTNNINNAIHCLRKIHKNFQEIDKICYSIHQLEEQADEVYHIAEANLFEIDIEIKELIKNKKILENLEKTVDYAEDVADIIEKLVKKSV
jgi:predicted phosphate transport protein (TIGR00153 family)